MGSFFDQLSYADVAKTIDHALLKPELDDSSVEAGCELAARYDVASVSVRPRDVERAHRLLANTKVAVGTVIGFPHGSSRTETKVFESRLALQNGARELDMVIEIGVTRVGATQTAAMLDEFKARKASPAPAASSSAAFGATSPIRGEE